MARRPTSACLVSSGVKLVGWSRSIVNSLAYGSPSRSNGLVRRKTLRRPQSESCARSFSATRGCDLWRLKNVNRSEEHTSELQSQSNLVCRLLLEKKKKTKKTKN